MRGVIKRVFLTRGFGFLQGEDGIERFMHIDDLTVREEWESMRSGTPVMFISQITADPASVKGNGLRAVQVKITAAKE